MNVPLTDHAQEKTMRTLVFSALALGALTTAAVAEPVPLTGDQLDWVTAGSHGEAHGSGGTIDYSFDAGDGNSFSGTDAGGEGEGAQGGGSGGMGTSYVNGIFVQKCAGGGGGGVGGSSNPGAGSC